MRKRQIIIVVKSLYQFQPLANEIPHAVHHGVGKRPPQIVVVQSFQKTALGVATDAVHEVYAAFTGIFLHRPFQVFALIIGWRRDGEPALQFIHHGIHVPLRQRPAPGNTAILAVCVRDIKYVADLHVAAGLCNNGDAFCTAMDRRPTLFQCWISPQAVTCGACQ